MTTLQDYREKYISLRAEESILQRDVEALKVKGNTLEDRSLRLEKMRVLIQAVAEQTQKNLEFRISKLVTTALSAVFDDPEEFLVKFVKRRGKTECDLLFIKNGREMNPIGFTGGGVLDITCFALRIAFWSLKKNRDTILIDEPFRNLHGIKEQERCSEMVKMLSDELGIQFLMVSDVDLVNKAADKVFNVDLIDGVSVVS